MNPALVTRKVRDILDQLWWSGSAGRTVRAERWTARVCAAETGAWPTAGLTETGDATHTSGARLADAIGIQRHALARHVRFSSVGAAASDESLVPTSSDRHTSVGCGHGLNLA